MSVCQAGTNGATVRTLTDTFVRLLKIRQNHWVCVSNMGCDAGTVKIYDSLHRIQDCWAINNQCQLAWMLFGQNQQPLTLHWVNIQHQTGGSDGGLFAIANATALCAGKDPVMCGYLQSCMRRHLAVCFSAARMVLFPSYWRQVNRSITLTTVVPLSSYWEQWVGLFGNAALMRKDGHCCK